LENNWVFEEVVSRWKIAGSKLQVSNINKFMNNPHIFITGINGFVGQNPTS
jgi:hypothetical protein